MFKKILVLLFVAIVMSACGMSPEDAKNSLSEKGYSFSSSGFTKAVKSKDLELLKLFATAEFPPADMERGLIAAIELGDVNAVKLILEDGASANVKGSYTDYRLRTFYYTALSKALEGKQQDIAKLLLDAGAAAKEPELGQAIEAGYLEIAKKIVDSGIKPGKSSFEMARKSGDVDILKWVLTQGVTVSNDDKLIATRRSMENGSFSMALMLLKSTDVNGKSVQGLFNVALDTLKGGLSAEQLEKYGANAVRDGIEVLTLLSNKGASALPNITSNPLVDMVRYKPSGNVKGRNETAAFLLEHGISPNSVPYDHKSVLELAIKEGDFGVAKVIVEHGADVKGGSYLADTIDAKAPELVDILLAHKASLSKRGRMGFTPLIMAVALGDEALVKKLLTQGGSINDVARLPSYITYSDNDPISLSAAMRAFTPITVAVALKHDAITDFLLQKKVGFLDDESRMALVLAVINGNVKLAKRLLDKGVVITARSMKGYDLLSIAIATQSSEMFDFLLSQGADVDSKFKRSGVAMPSLLEDGVLQGAWNPVSAAIKSDSLDLLNKLVLAGANLNEPKDKSSRYNYTTPLTLALGKYETNKDIKVAEILLSHGASLKHSGETFVLACKAGDEVLVDLMLKYGMSPNQSARIPVSGSGMFVSRGGRSALQVAVSSGNDAIVQKLLTYGANVDNFSIRSAKAGGYMDISRILNNPPVVSMVAVKPEILKKVVITKPRLPVSVGVGKEPVEAQPSIATTTQSKAIVINPNAPVAKMTPRVQAAQAKTKSIVEPKQSIQQAHHKAKYAAPKKEVHNYSRVLNNDIKVLKALL